jgi:hypothetical protein
MDGLSDRAWRTFTGSLMWCNEAGTDGVVPKRALRFLHPDGVDDATRRELVRAGLWADAEDGGVLVTNWVANGQELAETIAWRKEQARIRQQNFRESKKVKDSKKTRDKSSDVTRDVGQEQDRRQKTGTEEQALDRSEARSTLNEVTGEVAWPLVTVPGASGRSPDGWAQTAPNEWAESDVLTPDASSRRRAS